ncbi:MAG: RidA family protein [Candidatus Promineifilaceae bacterium]
MEKVIIATPNAPAAVGPYSQGVRAGNLVYTAGQVALDPATGKLVEGDIEAQTHQVFRNLQAVLRAAGTDLANVVKTTVFLQDMDHFAAMNQAYAQHFAGQPPARTTVQLAKLPLGALVEIEAVALI